MVRVSIVLCSIYIFAYIKKIIYLIIALYHVIYLCSLYGLFVNEIKWSAKYSHVNIKIEEMTRQWVQIYKIRGQNKKKTQVIIIIL